jgi:hypothetical protein
VSDPQLDLFAGSWAYETRPAARPPPVVPGELDDATLLAAIPTAGLPDGPALAREAGRRRLHAAVPVLEAYCRRFAGFGTQRAVAEQLAALEALHAIAGKEVADSVARIISRGWVQGPTLTTAVAVAAQLDCVLPGDVVAGLLRHADPAARADACRLARTPGVVDALIDLLDDLHREVAIEAACALARQGRGEGRPLLLLALKQAPSVPLINAVALIADRDCIVELGRIGAGKTPLARAARDALETIEHELAARILQRLSV